MLPPECQVSPPPVPVSEQRSPMVRPHHTRHPGCMQAGGQWWSAERSPLLSFNISIPGVVERHQPMDLPPQDRDLALRAHELLLALLELLREPLLGEFRSAQLRLQSCHLLLGLGGSEGEGEGGGSGVKQSSRAVRGASDCCAQRKDGGGGEIKQTKRLQ